VFNYDFLYALCDIAHLNNSLKGIGTWPGTLA